MGAMRFRTRSWPEATPLPHGRGSVLQAVRTGVEFLYNGPSHARSRSARHDHFNKGVDTMKRAVLAAIVLVTICYPAFGQTKAHTAAVPAVYPMQEGFVDAHGVLIYYKSLGRGTLLVIVHGRPRASHDYLLPCLLPLARDHRVIFIDERGSGRSEKLEDPKS